MKKIFLIISLPFLLALGSCKKYLDTVPDDILTIDDVFKTRTNVIKYLGNIYQSLPNEFNQRFAGFENAGNWTGAADEGKYTWDFNYSTNLNKSAWAATDGNVNGYWDSYYRAIRNATDFIQKIDAATPEISNGEKTIYKGEARALRAFYYFQLLRLYGPVVILGEDLISPSAPNDEVLKPRTSFDGCINFIVSQLDRAYTELPVIPSYAGKMTKGIAKAYKLQALMLSASPLFNGNTDYVGLKNNDGTVLINQTFDAAKWTKAAATAKDFINEFAPGTYTLYKIADADPFKSAYLSCRDVILDNWNKEWIFGRSNSRYDLIRYDRTPFHAGYSSQRGAGANGATQTQADAYFMVNGKSIFEPGSGYAATGFSNYQAPPFDQPARNTYNQWVNREPRFYVGITYSNSTWLYPDENTGNPIITNIEFNGNSGLSQSTSDVSPTGYIVRKGVANTNNDRGSLFLRLGQVYLDYAEALNESTPSDPDILKYLNLIRERGSIPQYGAGATPLPVPASQADMRTAIRNERRVELAFENVRYFDTRRWKIAEQTDAGPFYGMDRTKNGAAFYNKTLLETRVFKKRDYLYPIPADEVLRNSLLKQNTGW